MIGNTFKQLHVGFLIILSLIIIGTVGFMLIEGWHILDAFYMTIITISTTGFKEIYPLSETGRMFTTFLIVFGVGALAYTGGRAVQFLVERELLRRGRMSRRINTLKNHFIVCGYGRMGKSICEELQHAGAPFLVVDNNRETIAELIEKKYIFLEGDATQDDVLIKAGIHNARGLVAVLPTDAENVFATLSAKVLNPEVFVVTRAVEEETESKLIKAGANRVIKPYEIGGSRMAQVLLRPGVVDFIDIVARGQGIDLSMEEIYLNSHSPLIGKTLSNSPIRRDLNIIIVSIFRKDGKVIYNPGHSTKLQEGDRLIAIGEKENLQKLNSLCFAS